jgi:DNA processing protein
LAIGIDALAHEACLKNNGLTVGVLGSGVDWPSIYPSANRYLAKRIIESGGCLLCEYPLGTMPTKYTFPMRNRIIAGLTLGTLVIEAAESSGALITAKCALEYNREVFAVPGSIYNCSSAGCNNLIKQGAKLVLSATDVLEELKLAQLPEIHELSRPKPASIEEEIILKNLSREPLHIDKLAKSCNIKINVLSGILMLMEMKGLIKNIGGQNYVLSS